MRCGVGVPVLCILGGDCCIVNDDQIFRIVFFGRLREIETPSDYRLAVEDITLL